MSAMTASCSGCGGRACSLASASVIHTEVCAGGLGTGRQGCICRSMGMAVLMRFSSRLGVGVWETQATLFPSTNCTLRPRSDPGAWHTLWVPRRSTLSPYQTSDGLSAGKAEKSFRSAHPKPYIAAKCAPGHRVVVGIAHRAHKRANAHLMATTAERHAGVLAALEVGQLQCPHFCVLLDLSAGFPHCCLVRDDIAVQRRHLMRPPTVTI